MVGTAVKVVDALGQIEVVGVLILIDGVTAELIVIVMALEVAVARDAQVAVDVMTQVTTDPVARVLVANVALLVPALVPLTFH